MNTKQSVALVSTSALAAGMAQGSVVYSGSLNLQQTFDSNNYRQAVNITGGANSDFYFGYETAANKPYVDARNPLGTTSQSGLVSILGKANNGLPVTTAGTMIDASYASLYPVVDGSIGARGYMYYNDAGDTVIGDWSNTAVTDAYVGIELSLSGGTSYGWVHFIDNPTTSPVSLTLVDWAYQSTPGVGIQASVIPEPSTAAFAGLGIASLLIRRKRR